MFQCSLVGPGSEGSALKSGEGEKSVHMERESPSDQVTYSLFLRGFQLHQLGDTLRHSRTLFLRKRDRALRVLYFNTQVVFQHLQLF